MPAEEKADVSQILRFRPNQLGGHQVLHRGTIEMEPAQTLDEHGFKRPKLGQSRLHQLQIRHVRFEGGFGIEQHAGLPRRGLEFKPVVVAGGLPDVQVQRSAPVHAAQEARGRTDQAKPHRRSRRGQGRRQPFQNRHPFVTIERRGHVMFQP